MINYDPNIRNGMHYIKVTLQQWEYKGYVVVKVLGNCKGFNVLSNIVEYMIDESFEDNPIGFNLIGEDDNGNEWFSCKLLDNEGNDCSCEDLLDDLADMIVSVEIIDYQAETDED